MLKPPYKVHWEGILRLILTSKPNASKRSSLPIDADGSVRCLELFPPCCRSHWSGSNDPTNTACYHWFNCILFEPVKGKWLYSLLFKLLNLKLQLFHLPHIPAIEPLMKATSQPEYIVKLTRWKRRFTASARRTIAATAANMKWNAMPDNDAIPISICHSGIMPVERPYMSIERVPK